MQDFRTILSFGMNLAVLTRQDSNSHASVLPNQNLFPARSTNFVVLFKEVN